MNVSTATAAATQDPRAIMAREPMRSHQVIAIGIATALNALDGFDVLSISFASPSIASEWGIDRAALGVVLSMELIGMAFGAFLLGALADRVGRRPTILACLVVMALGMGLASVAPGIVELSALRFLTGLGIGGMLAATNAIVAEYANARRRNLSVAIMAGGYPMGAVFGGAVASWLLATTGQWQTIFYFGALMTAAFIPLVFWLVPETIAFLIHRQPPRALVRVNRTMARLGYAALSDLPPKEASQKEAGFADLFAPDIRATTLLLTVAYFAHIMTFYFLMKWTPKIIADMGFPAASAASVLVWANVGGATGSITLSMLTRRFGVRALTAAAMGGGVVAIAALGAGFSTLSSLSAVALLGGFFTNGATAGLYAIFAQSFPARLRAGGTGFVIGVGRGGAALGPILAGFLFSSGWPLAWVAPVMAVGSLVGAGALRSLRYREAETA
jgi:benzoate transport